MTHEEYKERRERVLNRVPSPPRYTQEEYERFKLICNERVVDSVEKFPSEIRDTVKAAFEYIYQTYGVTEIKLRGSWAKGEWVTENTDEGFKYLREKIRFKNKVSDIDLSAAGIPHHDFFEFNGLKIDLLPDNSSEGILIWSKF